MSDEAVAQALAGIGLKAEDLPDEVLVAVAEHVGAQASVPKDDDAKVAHYTRVGEALDAEREAGTISDKEYRQHKKSNARRLAAARNRVDKREADRARTADMGPEELAALVRRW